MTRYPEVRSLNGRFKAKAAYLVPIFEMNCRFFGQLTTLPPGIHLVPITNLLAPAFAKSVGNSSG